MHAVRRISLTLVAAALAAQAVGSEKPIAIVNGLPIASSKVDFIVKQVAERGTKDSPELRQRIKDDLVTKEIVAQEALRLGLDRSPDAAVEMELAKQGVLLKAFVQDYQKKNPITDEAAKVEFDKMKASMPSKEYRARHILVKTEKDANDILAALKKGKKFEDLAKEKSEDPGSKARGGDLDWSSPANFVKEFGDAMAGLSKGKTTEKPVKTQYGFHIIRLEDVRDAKGPAFDEVKGQLIQQIQSQRLDKLVADLKAKAKVE